MSIQTPTTRRRKLLAIAVLTTGLVATAAVLYPPAILTQVIANEQAPVRVAVQVNANDTKVMNLALNNVANIVNHYKAAGRKVEIQVVTYGDGLHMLRDDSSPVKPRIAAMSLELPGVTFHACANTRANMAKQEGKDVPLISEARIVPSGVVTLIELQQKGFAYIRP